MTESDLLNILNNLEDNQFKDFKWHLKYEKVGDIPPIQESQLSKAERRDVVDLMVRKYESESVEMTKRILKKINRNDLVKKLSNISSGAQGQSQEETNMTSHPDSRSACIFIFFIILDTVHTVSIWTVTHTHILFFRFCASAHSILK